MTDRDLMQQALDAMRDAAFDEEGYTINADLAEAHDALEARLAHCDRCGKKMGGEGDIHTCSPDPIGDAQDRLIAELAAQPEQEPHIQFMSSDELKPRTPAERKAYLEGVMDGKIYAVRDGLATPPAATVEDNSQDWAGMSGIDAYMLIDRSANDWADVSKMMGEWLAANTLPTAQQIDEAYSAGYSNGMTEGYEAGKAYAAAQRQWVGLTKYEGAECWYGKNCLEQSPPFDGYAEAIEAKLKEKNT